MLKSAKLKKFRQNLESNPRLLPQFSLDSETRIKFNRKPISLSQFITNKVPVAKVRIVKQTDGKIDQNAGLKARAELSNGFYKTQKMKINFAISHKQASVVCQTSSIPKNAQNLKIQVIYKYNTINVIPIDFPQDTDPDSLSLILSVDVFEIRSIQKFYVVVGML